MMPRSCHSKTPVDLGRVSSSRVFFSMSFKFTTNSESFGMQIGLSTYDGLDEKMY